MKKSLYLVLSIIQLVIGLLLVVSFIVLAVAGENVNQYIPTLVIAIVFVIMGIIGIVNCKGKK